MANGVINNVNGNNVRVIRLGLGMVVSNWGTHNGVPAVFIEPVLGEPQAVGVNLPEWAEPQIKRNAVSDGGTIIEIHDERGLAVVLEDFQSAIRGIAEPV